MCGCAVCCVLYSLAPEFSKFVSLARLLLRRGCGYQISLAGADSAHSEVLVCYYVLSLPLLSARALPESDHEWACLQHTPPAWAL